MGGATQPQGHAQIVINMIDLGIEPPGSRRCAKNFAPTGGRVYLETGLPSEVYRDLTKMGHRSRVKMDKRRGINSKSEERRALGDELFMLSILFDHKKPNFRHNH